MRAEYPYAVYGDEVANARRQARTVTLALGSMATLAFTRILLFWWQRSELAAVVADPTLPRDGLERADGCVQALMLPGTIALIVTGLLFVSWLKSVLLLAREFGGTFAWQPGQVFFAFVIPVLNWMRPYQIVCAVHDSLEPEVLPEPETLPDESTGYRAVVPVPEAVALPHASIGAWWACFWAANIIGRVSGTFGSKSVDAFVTGSWVASLSMAVDIVAAVLAIAVVRALDARLAERYRRLAHNSLDTLRASGFDLAPRRAEALAPES